VIFGDLRNLWRFLGLVERRKILFILVYIIHFGHTRSSWTWARRAREPVEVSWARNYFLVGWEVNPVGLVKRSVSARVATQGNLHQPWVQVFLYA